MHLPYRPRIIALSILCVFVVVVGSFSFLPQGIKARITDNIFARQLLPLYRSLRKLPDLVFVPYLFTPSNLEKVDIVIDPKDIYYLNDFLPKTSPFTSVSLNTNRAFTKAYFTGAGYVGKVDIRYKGLGPNHWNSFKKSYRIQFPSEYLYKGGSGLNLVIPDDKAYYADLLNEYRAKKFGLLTKNIRLTNVTINGQSYGVYLTSDNWSHEFLEGRRISENSNLFGLDEAEFLPTGDFTNYESILAFSPKYTKVWKSYTRPPEMTSFEEITTLLELIEHAPDPIFKKLIPHIVDLESFYRWDVINVLAGNPMVDYENIVMVFNIATGKFEFMIVDTYATSITEEYIEQSKLAQRILAIDDFKEERDRILRDYINNKDNLRDDLAFYDALYKDTKNEFFKDNAKSETNFAFMGVVRGIREAFEKNFEDASKVFAIDYATQSETPKPKEMSFTGTFEHFAEIGLGREQFLARNPEFVSRGKDAVALLPGAHAFSRTVIIPAGVRLIIDPSATVYLAENVSVLVYGPIEAKGTKTSLIRITRLYPGKKWGVFGSVNAKDPSTLTHVVFDGGSGATINGIVFTGMAAFHGSDVVIQYSSFYRAADDDGLNVKYGHATIEYSVFGENSSDAIDLDFAPLGSRVSNNTFTHNGLNGGGDGIDLSWGDQVDIHNNTIHGCTDKGISVGEHSTTVIHENTITDCPIGIAVKDLSEAEITDNHITDVDKGISAYRKKLVFGGGTARESRNIFERVQETYATDELSTIHSFK